MKTPTPCNLCGSTKPHECIGFAPAVGTSTIEDQKKTIIGWMNKYIPRGKTIPIFEDLVDELALTAEKRGREEIYQMLYELQTNEYSDDSLAREWNLLDSILYAITNINKV